MLFIVYSGSHREVWYTKRLRVKNSTYCLFWYSQSSKGSFRRIRCMIKPCCFFAELALAYVHNPPPTPAPRKFSIKDIIGDGYLMAVPKFRRTIERRLKRKYGTPEYNQKILLPKTNILVCKECGHHYESGRLCG